MQLIEALRYSGHASMAFVGAGGKTTALFRLANEILSLQKGKNQSETVLVTTTTHFGTWQKDQADAYFAIRSADDIEKLVPDLPNGVVMLLGGEVGRRVRGLPAALLEKLQFLAEKRAFSLLIEADGAHLRPLKAPAIHEPAIPDFVQSVVVVAGLSGLSKPLSTDWVHRPESFARLSGLHSGENVTKEALVKVLIAPVGGLKNIPPGADKILLLNQADTPLLRSQARWIAKQLTQAYPSVIIASLNPMIETSQPKPVELEIHHKREVQDVIEPIAGIILAAGQSDRLGQPKQLLLWKGQPLIRHVVQTALQSGFSQINVVVGAYASEVSRVIADLDVRIVNNPDWTAGMSSSIRAGLASLQGRFGGAVFLQADQPQIPPALIHSMIRAHQSSLSPIIAPQIGGKRANPVFFDRSTFSALMSLNGDWGGRALFSRIPIETLEWNDERLLLDIDTMEDYRMFLEKFPESETYQ